MPPHSAGLVVSVERLRALRDSGLICDLCKGLLKDPRLLPCGHSYCRECVHPIVENYKRRKCPGCSCPCATDDLRTSMVLSNLLSAFDTLLKSAPASPLPPPPPRDADGFVLPMLPVPSFSAPPRRQIATPPLSPILPPAKRARSAPGRVLLPDESTPDSKGDTQGDVEVKREEYEEEDEEDEAIIGGHDEQPVLGGARWPLGSSEVKVVESPPPAEAKHAGDADMSTAAPSPSGVGEEGADGVEDDTDGSEEGSPALVKLEPMYTQRATQHESTQLETTATTVKQEEVGIGDEIGMREGTTAEGSTPSTGEADPRSVLCELPMQYEPFPTTAQADLDLPLRALRQRCGSSSSPDLKQCLDRIAAADARLEAMAPALRRWGINHDSEEDGVRVLWRRAGWREAVPAALVVAVVAALGETPAEAALREALARQWSGPGETVAVAASGLPAEQKELAIRVCSTLRVRFVVDRDRQSLLLHRRVTHLVTMDPAPRTLRYCCALLRGRWIVKNSWLSAASSAGRLVSEGPYEVGGDTGRTESRAPAIGRAALAARRRGEDTFEWGGRGLPARGPLQGATAEAYGDFKSPTLDEVRQLILLAGVEGERAVAGRPHYIFCATMTEVAQAKDLGGEAMHFRRLLDAICKWDRPMASMRPV
eukprot:Hpha_TRINITY_DN22764_c0_g1::TRINITY_DN22764_c0_g1_i1::g.34279::m.34279